MKMEDQLTAFANFFSEFKQTALWAQMHATVENSPWHREANVAVHTQMIIDHYLARYAAFATPRGRMLTLLAIVFHDTGKPEAETMKHSAERGTYRVYAGHEKLSARAWVDFAMSHPDLLKPLDISIEDVSDIAFLIEHHLPYALKDQRKREALKRALWWRFGELNTFFDLLQSDAAGRISDGHAEKLESVNAWIEEFTQLPVKDEPREMSARLAAYVLSGPSGAGKSTFVKTLKNPVVFSLDACRLSFFGQQLGDAKETYAAAFKHATANEREFATYADKEWKAALYESARSMRPLVIDNMNLTRKSRAKYVAELMSSKAYRPGGGGGANCWFVYGVTFYAPLAVVKERQLSRSDKELPAELVEDMYFRQEEFLVGSECHELVVCGNL